MSEEVSVIDTFAEGFPSFEQYIHFVHSVLQFEGKTLDQWLEEVNMPIIGGQLTIAELEAYNHHYLNTNDKIMRNLGISRATFDAAKMHYENAIVMAKRNIMAEIERSDAQKKKAPSAEALQSMAMSRSIEQYNAYKIAELFYEFWKIQYDRLKLIDNRLESLNILKRYGDN